MPSKPPGPHRVQLVNKLFRRLPPRAKGGRSVSFEKRIGILYSKGFLNTRRETEGLRLTPQGKVEMWYHDGFGKPWKELTPKQRERIMRTVVEANLPFIGDPAESRRILISYFSSGKRRLANHIARIGRMERKGGKTPLEKLSVRNLNVQREWLAAVDQIIGELKAGRLEW